MFQCSVQGEGGLGEWKQREMNIGQEMKVPLCFPLGILGLEIRAARVMGTHSVLLCEGFDVLLPVTQNGISQWIVWLG